MADQVLFHLFTFFTLISGISAWRCAKYKHYFSQQPDYIECFWDCCGNSFNRHCCAPIGIIVGCSIVGAVVVAAFTVLFICWWQRRRARQTKGPKLFHNRRHSHYPVAPTSVTRPAPQYSHGGPPPQQQRPGYPPYNMGGPPHPQQGYGPPHHPNDGYRAPPEQYYDSSDRERMYRHGPPPPTHQQGYNEKPPLSSDFESDREEAQRLPEKRPVEEFSM